MSTVVAFRVMAHFLAQALKKTKKSLYFRKWYFLALILKKCNIFSKQSFSYISANETLHLSAQRQKIKTSTPRKFLILLIFSQKKAALMFQEKETPKKFFIFQEVTFRA